MKLRIKGNSLRLRVTRSELRELARGGRIEESIHFAAGEGSKLTYAVECSRDANAARVRFNPPEVVVILPASEVRQWEGSDQVGIYARIGLDQYGSLELSVEKDFACLNDRHAGDPDAFPNPRAGAAC